MLKVKGIYDGKKIVLLEPVSLLPNTPVEVLIPEQEQTYWQKLLNDGLITKVRSQPKLQPFTPVSTTGTPVSKTIIEERR